MNENSLDDFLNDTSLLKTPKSPQKTSTSTKENKVLYRNVFERKQNVSDVLNSLFDYADDNTRTESALNEVTNLKTASSSKTLITSSSNYADNSSTSIAGSERNEENSSLGIISLGNLTDLSDSDFFLPMPSLPRKQFKSTGDLNYTDKFKNTLCSENKKSNSLLPKSQYQYVQNTIVTSKENDDSSTCASLSDIEFDPKNIPELQSDFDFTDIGSDSDYKKIDVGKTMNYDVQLKFLYGDRSEEVKKILAKPSKFDEDTPAEIKSIEPRDFSITNLQEPTSLITSTENSQMSYDPKLNKPPGTKNSPDCEMLTGSISENSVETPRYEKVRTVTGTDIEILKPGCHGLLNKLLQPAQKISIAEYTVTPSKVNPFMDVSSFQVDELYEENMDSQQTVDGLKKKTNKLSESEVVFLDDQISARSSSYGSSTKSLTKSIETSSVNKGSDQTYDTEEKKFCENTSKIQSFNDNLSEKSYAGVAFPVSYDDDYAIDLAFQTNLLNEGTAKLIADGDDWENRLGVSESEFFSAEVGFEMLKKNEEEFEKDNLLQVGVNESVTSQVSTWSACNHPQEYSPPSWWCETNSSTANVSDLKISIGQIIGARTEALGALSDDQHRERPFFGTVVVTPPRLNKGVSGDNEDTDDIKASNNLSASQSTCASSICESSTNSILSFSTISQVISDVSIGDGPSQMATKILSKIIPDKPKKLVSRTRRNSSMLRKGKLGTIQENQNLMESSNSSPHLNCIREKGFHSNSVAVGGQLDSKKHYSSTQRSGLGSRTKTATKLFKKANSRTETTSTCSDSDDVKTDDLCTVIKARAVKDKTVNAGKLSMINQNLFKTREISSERNISNLGTTKKLMNAHEKTKKALLRSKSLESVANGLVNNNTGNLNNCMASTPADLVHYSSLENVFSFSTVDCAVGNTDSESNNSSKTSTKSDKSSNCNFCMHSLQAPCTQSRPVSACSLSCATNMPSVMHTGMRVPTQCMKTFNTVQDHYLQFMLPHTCPSYSSFDFMNYGSGMNLAATLPLHPTCSRPMQGLSLPVMQPGTTMCVTIKGPNEMNYSNIICIGDIQQSCLTLQNPTSTPLFYHSSLISATLNDSLIPVDAADITASKVVHAIGGGVANIQLTFSPKLEGKYKVELQVSASYSVAEQPSYPIVGFPHIVKVFFEAERPRINIQCQGKDRLDLDGVLKGSTVTRSLNLVNLNRATVPLRLIISGDEKGHSFNFGVQEINNLQNSARGAEWHFLTPKVMLCRLPGYKDNCEKHKLDIPIIFYANTSKNDNGKDVPEKVSGTISAMLESTVVSEMLASIRFSAAVATVDLALKHPSQSPLIMKAKKNSKTTTSVIIWNKGTIPVTVDLAVLGESDCFSVLPPTVHLQPQKDANLVISYTSLSSEKMIGTLQAAAQPQGQVFILADIVGETIAIPPVSKQYYQSSSGIKMPSQSLRMPRDSQNGVGFGLLTHKVESDRRYLAWGGIDIDQDITKSFVIRNPSPTEILTAKVYIKEKSHSFQIIDDILNQKVSCMDIVLHPKLTKCIKISYHPVEARPSSGHLAIKPSESIQQKVFSIPLCGYGGVSKVRILSLPQKEGLGYCLEMTSQPKNETDFSNITLCNSGSRAAFVKALALGGENLISSEEVKVTIEPSEFVLLPNESKSVLVARSNSMQNYGYRAQSQRILVFYFGDEVMRQKIRRSSEQSNFKLQPSDPLKNVDFNIPYVGEEKVPYDSSYANSPKDVALFYANMQRLLVHMTVAPEDTSFSRMTSFSALSFLPDSSVNQMFNNNNTVLSRPSTDMNAFSPPVKQSLAKSVQWRQTAQEPADTLSILPSQPRFIDELVDSNSIIQSRNSAVLPDVETDASPENIFASEVGSKNDVWTVEPGSLTLDAENKDGRLVIANHTNHNLKFKLTWSVNVICVSPVQGLIPAKGQMGLRIKIISLYHGKLSEDKGFIKIFCSGLEKFIPVEVHKITSKPKLCNRSFRNNSILDNSMQATSTENLTLLSDHSVSSKNQFQAPSSESVLSFPKYIKLEDTPVGTQSETSFQIQNTSKDSLQWTLLVSTSSSVESQQADRQITMPNITLIPSHGLLKTMETATVNVYFAPTNIGCISQLFELSIDQSDCFKCGFQINIEGMGCPKSAIKAVKKSNDTLSENSSVIKEGNHIALEKRNESLQNQKPFFATPEIVEFPVTEVGKKSTMRIMLKNTSPENCKVSVLKPQPPFDVKFLSLTVKGKHFLNLPIHFHPVAPSTFHGLVVFQNETGHDASVKLIGTCH